MVRVLPPQLLANLTQFGEAVIGGPKSGREVEFVETRARHHALEARNHGAETAAAATDALTLAVGANPRDQRHAVAQGSAQRATEHDPNPVQGCSALYTVGIARV